MAQFTWTGAVDDAYANALNWDPTTGPPGFGDTVIIGFGTVDAAANQIFADNLIEIGSTAGLPATLVFDNDATTGLSNPTITGSTIDNTVSGQTTAAQTALDANGPFVNQGTIVANGPAGSIFTINVDQNGSNAGFFINQGEIEADAGDTLAIVVGATSEIYNSGLILANGGSVLITTSGSDQIVGGYAPIVGLVAIQAGGTVEFNAALPFDPTAPTTTSGTRYYFAFTDGAGDLLKIDQVAQFSGNVLGFEAGDTIDVGALAAITGYTYDTDGILTLYDAAGVAASLVVSGNFNTGTFTAGSSFAGGSFGIGASGGDTVITTVAVNDVWTATSGANAWTTGANWSGNAPPGGSGVGVIGNGAAQTNTVTTGSGSVPVGTLILNNPDATIEVGGTLDVTPGTYLSTVQQIAGTIQVDAGATLEIDALRQYQTATALDLQTGATLIAEGRPSTQFTNDGSIVLQPGGNRFALSLQGATTIDDAIVDAGPNQPGGIDGGGILIGQDGAGTPATVLAEDGATVTDTYAAVFSSPTSYGSLTITGANTVWDDAGDPSDTETTRGYMLIGQTDQNANTPTPPYARAAQLTVSAGATLDEATDATLGNSVDSAGTVTIDGANWNIGNVGGNFTSGTQNGFLQVGRYGIGDLKIQDSGTVTVGNGGTIVNDGSTQIVNYAVDIGHETGASGTLSVDGSGSRLTTLNTVLDGDGGTGVFDIQDSAFAAVGGNFDLGGNTAGSDGGVGSLAATLGGEIELTADAVLAVWQGSSVSVDGTSGIDVGTSGTFVAGAVHIDSGSNGSGLRGDGTIGANVDNDGNIHATDNGAYGLSTGGLLDITGSVTGTGAAQIANGATLEIGGTIAADQQIGFIANSGLPETFILGAPGVGLASQVTGLQDSDRIELGGLDIQDANLTSADTVTVDLVGGGAYLLTDMHFAPGASTDFITGTDAGTGYDYIQVTCFAAGTRIATPDGQAPVESLRVGQPVLTVLGGRAQPVRWIGHRRIDCRRHPNPVAVWPVRIRAGACGPGLPARDLFVSPDHALLIDGVLIPAKYLVNGASIVQVPVDTVLYYHIELSRHDVVLAEGLPAETYLDTDDRATFDNGRAPLRLHPDLSSLTWEAKGCAPLVVTGPILASACARLGGIAVGMGSAQAA